MRTAITRASRITRLAACAAAVAACSSASGGGSGDGGSSGAAGSASADGGSDEDAPNVPASEGGEDGTQGGSCNPGRTTVAACLLTGTIQCLGILSGYPNPSEWTAKYCGVNVGTPAAACPTAAPVSCCVGSKAIHSAEVCNQYACFSGGGAVQMASDYCTQVDGTLQSSVP
jgi:hypothetical protein